jgi:hypothetical protein
MTTRMIENLVKLLFFIVILTVLILQSALTNAQTFTGLDARFGVRLLSLESDIPQLQAANVVEHGGRIGFNYGNDIVSTSTGVGYYSSTAATPGTMDQYEAGVRMHFCPLSWILDKSPMVEPYLTGGITYSNHKFYGYYINREPGITNYSQAEAPYLGSVSQMSAGVGAGVKVKLLKQYDFINLFSEIYYGKRLTGKNTDIALQQTRIAEQLHVSLGLSFGFSH